MVVTPDDLDACRLMMEQGASTDDVLALLRGRGRGKVESMAVVSKLPGMDLRSAKPLVHNSPVWADRYEADEGFHDTVDAALRDEEGNKSSRGGAA
jgi:hypothetical protein